MPHRPQGSLHQLYEDFNSVEAFPVNAALIGLVPDEDSIESPNCKLHPLKPLDYYCLKCHEVICADCFIFGNHQEHKLSKKKELKDLNGYLIAKLDKVYSSNRMFGALKEFASVEAFLNNQSRDKLTKLKKKTERRFEVNLKRNGNKEQNVFKQIRKKLQLFFDNFEKIITFENKKVIESSSEHLSFNPMKDLTRLEKTFIKIKLENESVTVDNFESLYNLIHQTNLEIR